MPLVKHGPYHVHAIQPGADPVRAVAEGCEHAFAAALLHAWTVIDFRPDQPMSELVDALTSRLETVKRQVVLAFTGGRVAMMRQIILGPNVHKAIPQIGIGFDTLPPQTEMQAQATAAQLVREIGNDLRETINATVTDGLNQGLGPEEIAANVRNGLGLTAAQSRAVANYRRLLEQRPEIALDRALRDRRFDATVQHSVATGAQLKPEQIDAQVAAYRRRYLNYRAYTIARYETLNASNAGALAELRNAVNDGRMPKNTRKRWLIAHDELTCPTCRSVPELQPDGVALDDDFEWQDDKNTGVVQAPPLHPSCRCTVTFHA